MMYQCEVLNGKKAEGLELFDYVLILFEVNFNYWSNSYTTSKSEN